MAQLWKGRFKKELAKETNDFNSSIKFDSRMFEEDIKGSIAHATMLGATGIIDKSGAWFAYGSEKLGQGKEKVRAFLDENPDLRAEIEAKLIEHLGMHPILAPGAPVDDDADEGADE